MRKTSAIVDLGISTLTNEKAARRKWKILRIPHKIEALKLYY